MHLRGRVVDVSHSARRDQLIRFHLTCPLWCVEQRLKVHRSHANTSVKRSMPNCDTYARSKSVALGRAARLRRYSQLTIHIFVGQILLGIMCATATDSQLLTMISNQQKFAKQKGSMTKFGRIVFGLPSMAMSPNHEQAQVHNILCML